MKTKITLILCLGVILTACKKNTVPPTVNLEIKGTWELRATRNGNIIPATYPPGNGHILVFSNVTFSQYTSGSLVDSGHYAKNTSSSNEYDILSGLAKSAFTSHAILEKDTLLITPGQPDISTAYYIRTGNSLSNN